MYENAWVVGLRISCGDERHPRSKRGNSAGGRRPLWTISGQLQEVVIKWLDTQLIDAASARIEWNGDPKPADLGTKGEHLYGYLVNFKVNARNRFGAYTGMQSH